MMPTRRKKLERAVKTLGFRGFKMLPVIEDIAYNRPLSLFWPDA